MGEPHALPPKPLPLPVESQNGGGRPNYIIFMPDQLRFDSLGCTTAHTPTAKPSSSSSSDSHDGFSVRTPNIDAFAARGSLFTNCFTQASVCSQSRCSMFTGTYPHVSGHRSLENLIKPWEPNVFRSLKEKGGYHVACLAPRGDTFAPEVTELSLSEYGFLETPEFLPGFARKKDDPPPAKDESIWGRLFYRGVRDRSRALDYDEAIVRSALKWLECPPRDKPWVLFMPLIFPHCPFQVEEPYFSMYDRGSIPPIGAVHEQRTDYEPRYMKRIRDLYGTDRATPEIWREVQATYYGMITRLDEQFGRIMGKVDELDLWKNTVTMFFTDHGEYLGDHGLIEKWPSGLSETLVHEPLIIGGAGLPEGQVIRSMAEMVDLVPTMLEMSGVGEHFTHNGLSWVKLLQDGDSSVGHKSYAFSEGGFLTSEEPLIEQSPYPYDLKAALQHQDTEIVGKAVSLRDETWTYVYRLYEPPELYHRQDDPHELHNLAGDEGHAHICSRYEAIILRWLLQSADTMPWTKDPRFPEVKLKSTKEQFEDRLKEYTCTNRDAQVS